MAATTTKAFHQMQKQDHEPPAARGRRRWPLSWSEAAPPASVAESESSFRKHTENNSACTRLRQRRWHCLPLLLPTIAALLLALAAVPPTQAQHAETFFSPDAGSARLNLVDRATEIESIRTIFLGDTNLVRVEGIDWRLVGDGEDDDDGNANYHTNNSTTLVWETSVNDIMMDSGKIELSGLPSRELPSSIDAGSFVIDKKETSKVSVTIFMQGNNVPFTESTTCSREYQAFHKGVSLLPLAAILLLTLTTQMVELSLFLGIWLGAWILEGSLAVGFTTTLTEFLIGALVDEGHVYVILFTVFLSGTVGMMQKSGGMLGFTNAVSKIAKTPRGGQFSCMLVGVVIFFDDYANVLLTGETMRPLLDVLCVSREKLAFIVDATAAPIASIAPISTWVGFEAGLVQDVIDVLQQRIGDKDELTIAETGFGVFLESIRYSYYSLLMIGLMLMLIGAQRDFGPMLVAERRVQIYDRTDGGPGAAHSGNRMELAANEPKMDQPLLMHNMLVPIVVLVVLVIAVLIQTGTAAQLDAGAVEESDLQDPLALQLQGDSNFIVQVYEKIGAGDSYLALLYGTMGMAFVSIILYHIQITVPGTGKLTLPTPYIVKEMLPWRKAEVEERGDKQPRFLLTIYESTQAFLYGMARIFLAIVILTLAWASGSVVTTVGVDRLFSSWITGGVIPYQSLPTVTFLIASLMGMTTGTSWGTMAILFPLILVPTYEASDGDPEIFYATVAAVLGGAVAGDHVSPISDTTVLTALACDVTLIGHVTTQAPYVFLVVVFAVLFGYLPIGYEAYPNIVGLLLGWIACGFFVMLVCAPVICKDGSWDKVTQLLNCGGKRSEELKELASDCAKKFRGESLQTAVEVELEVSLRLQHDGIDTNDDEEANNNDGGDEISETAHGGSQTSRNDDATATDEKSKASKAAVGSQTSRNDDATATDEKSKAPKAAAGSQTSRNDDATAIDEKSKAPNKVATNDEETKSLVGSTTPSIQSDSEKRVSLNKSEEQSA